MSLPTKITQALKELKGLVPDSVHASATKIIDLLHQKEQAVDEQLVISKSKDHIFLHWSAYSLLSILSEGRMVIDRVGCSVHRRYEPTSEEECARLLGREIRNAISERAEEIPEEELEHFNELPRTGKFERAFKDAEAFLKGILKEKLLLDRVQIGQTEDSFCFEWNRTYINIPIEGEIRFIVHYIPYDKGAAELLHFKDVESALHMTAFYVRRCDDI